MLSFLRNAIGPRHPLRLSWHFLRALVAAACYGFPARKLTVIGVTGTDGKTTTVGMVAHILESAGIPSGALSTAFLQVKGERTWNATQKTSPSPFVIQRYLRNLVRAGCAHAVLECSSHGLVQGRLRWTWPAVAAITNTSPEHLDYHGTLEQYRKDKAKLFWMLRGNGTKVLNADDETFDAYSRIPSEQTIVYSLREKRIGEEIVELALKIPGDFNKANALCAASCAHAVGIPLEQCIHALGSFPGIPGRLERVDEDQPFTVFVDFTVTPAAYEKTLIAVKEMLPAGKRLLVLTGSCGDRMREKRPTIGRICSEHADIVVVTNEDPYTEDPEKIIDEVWAGIDQGKTEAYRISDRREAIALLLRKAQPGDIVLLCGKGSDVTMWTARGQVPWDERAVVRSLLHERRTSY